MEIVRKNKLVLLFLLPAILFYTLFVIVPLFQSLLLSFYNWKGFGPKEFVGLKNYILLFTSDHTILIALRNTLYLLLVALFIMIPLSLIFANSICSKIKGSNFFSTIIFMPCVVSTVIIALMWGAIFNGDSGPINSILRYFHLNSLAIPWLGDPRVTIWVVIFVNTWQYVGYHMLIFVTSLEAIPQSIFEAASIDGASGFKKLIHVTVPLLKEAFKINIILAAIGSFKAFDLFFAMTSGGPGDSTQMLGVYMYQNTFTRLNFGYGSAIAMLIFFMSITASLIQQRISKAD